MQAFWIPSSSMEDTLQVGDNVVVSRLTPRLGGIERGDVVVFKDTEGWLPPAPVKQGFDKVADNVLTFTGLRPASGEQHLVKRVIGVGGDHVSCCDPEGRLQVNGTSINEPYLAPYSDNTTIPFDVTVPDGHLWVMGDNRNHSADSRAHIGGPESEFVAVKDVVGKVFWITWPIDHWEIHVKRTLRQSRMIAQTFGPSSMIGRRPFDKSSNRAPRFPPSRVIAHRSSRQAE